MIRRAFRAEGLALLLTVSALPATAGDIRRLDLGRADLGLARPTVVVIFNDHDQRVSFNLSGSESTERTYQIDGRDRAEFTDDRSTRYVIEVVTEGSAAVRYELSGGRRYRIYWNEPSRRYDVAHLTGR